MNVNKLKARKAALTVLALGAASSVVVFGSLAAWTASTTNPGNTVTAGDLTMTNSKGTGVGNPVLETNVTDARPGSTSSDTVTITNSSSGPMAVSLTQSNVSDGMSDGDNVMKFTIHDDTRNVCIYPAQVGACPSLDNTTVGADWNGAATINALALPGTGGANWAAAEAHDFTFVWEYTDNGVVNNTNNGSNPTASFDLAWNGVPA